MSRIDASKVDFGKVKGPVSAVPPAHGQASSTPIETSEEDRSKDVFFARVAEMTEAMIARHGKEFAIGTLVLAAKFVAEGRPLVNRGFEDAGAADAAKPVELTNGFRESK